VTSAKTIVRSLTPFQCLSLPKIRFCNNGDEVRRGQRAHGLQITAELAINLKTAKVLGLDVLPGAAG